MKYGSRLARCVQDRLGAAGALLIAIAAPVAGQNAPQDYPQWRGRNGDGSASAFVSPSAWPDMLTRGWQVDVGEGYATPLVVGGAVYVFTRREGNEVIAALAAATGAERWRSSYPLPYTPSSPTKAHGSGPKATPLFHAGKLFTIVANASRDAFEPLKRYVVADSATWAQPAISGKRVFIKDATALTLWTIE